MLRKRKIIDYNLLRTKGVTFNRLDMNKLIKSPSESWEHFAVKSQIFYILRALNHDVLTEFEISGFGIGDILDVSSRITC